jgi:hypothetical protein
VFGPVSVSAIREALVPLWTEGEVGARGCGHGRWLRPWGERRSSALSVGFAEIDARVARLYGLNEEEPRHVLATFL